MYYHTTQTYNRFLVRTREQYQLKDSFFSLKFFSTQNISRQKTKSG